MRFLRTLSEGDKFRTAYANQRSLNNLPMPRESTFLITKVYPQSPYVVIAVKHQSSDVRNYSLGANTPVLLPREFNPTTEQVLKFIGASKRKKVVGYRVLWDGATTLKGVCTPQAAALVKMMFALGKREYGAKEILGLIDVHYEKFYPGGKNVPPINLMAVYRRHLVQRGLLEEVVDDAPISSTMQEANIGFGGKL